MPALSFDYERISIHLMQLKAVHSQLARKGTKPSLGRLGVVVLKTLSLG